MGIPTIKCNCKKEKKQCNCEQVTGEFQQDPDLQKAIHNSLLQCNCKKEKKQCNCEQVTGDLQKAIHNSLLQCNCKKEKKQCNCEQVTGEFQQNPDLQKAIHNSLLSPRLEEKGKSIDRLEPPLSPDPRFIAKMLESYGSEPEIVHAFLTKVCEVQERKARATAAEDEEEPVMKATRLESMATYEEELRRRAQSQRPGPSGTKVQTNSDHESSSDSDTDDYERFLSDLKELLSPLSGFLGILFGVPT